jgi:hypothetical protein
LPQMSSDRIVIFSVYPILCPTLGGDGVLAAMLLGGLLSASPSIPKVGKLAADEGFGEGSQASFSETIIAFCSLLLNPTAMCLNACHCGR